jgi:hypothetical protein|tara:strand:+ start:5163 stop:5900 length:738 start_codon:yes stop_codon:yes gene_type:complete
MKFAIQLAGQIRGWKGEVGKNTDVNVELHWKVLKSKLKQNGVDVDMHICSWDDDYTKNLDLSYFETANLIPLNNHLLQDKKDKLRRNKNAQRMMPISYQNYYGGRFRRLYQKENNIKYDVILLSRPDIIFKSVEQVVNYFTESKKGKTQLDRIKSEYSTIHIPYGTSNCIARKKTGIWISEDYYQIGNEHSINLFCNGFLHTYLQTSQSFLSTSHNYPAITCMKTQLKIKGMHSSKLKTILWRNK